MEALITHSALVSHHLVLRTDTEADCPEVVAVHCWGGAAKRLKGRGDHIGWAPCHLRQPPQTHRAAAARPPRYAAARPPGPPGWWQTANCCPKSLALDDKSIGAKGRLGGIVTLCFHSTGQPLAQSTYSGKKNDCELPVARRPLDTRESSETNGGELKSETRSFITSLLREKRSASRPRKEASGGQMLSLLRGAILRLHDHEVFKSLNASYHHHSAKA